MCCLFIYCCRLCMCWHNMLNVVFKLMNLFIYTTLCFVSFRGMQINCMCCTCVSINVSVVGCVYITHTRPTPTHIIAYCIHTPNV